MNQEIEEMGLDSDSARLLLKSVQGYAIYLLDPGGHVTTWNLAAQTIKGYSAREVLGKHLSMFYAPKNRAAGELERELYLCNIRCIFGGGTARPWGRPTVLGQCDSDSSVQ